MSLRYPEAKQDVNGKMKTQGQYAGGFPQGAIREGNIDAALKLVPA